MTDRKLYIRTDANSTIATGHMIRCLSVADAAKGLGIDTVFIVSTSDSGQMARLRGYETINLDRQWDDFDGEIPVISALIKDLNISYMLVDSYYVTSAYMEALSSLTRTAYIDDLHERVWPCNVIINYAVYCDLFDYANEYKDATRLLGCSYMPLRLEYNQIAARTCGKATKALVVTGGMDELHFMKNMFHTISASDGLKDIDFTFICGRFNPDLDQLTTMAEQVSNINVLPALPTLKEAMLDADILVTAGGTTLYEMAATGLPGIAFRIADNQCYNVDTFAKLGLVLDAGDVRYDFSYTKLADMIRGLVDNQKQRQDMSTRLMGLVDGKGALRMAKGIMNID